jgi:hypothetical protein
MNGNHKLPEVIGPTSGMSGLPVKEIAITQPYQLITKCAWLQKRT